MVVSFMIAVPFSLGRPSWAASHPCYERLCPDPTPPPGFLSRTFWYAGSGTDSESRQLRAVVARLALRLSVEVEIDEELVRTLLHDQHPTWPIAHCGWAQKAGTTRYGASVTTSLFGCRGRPRPQTHCCGTFCGVIDFGDLCARDPACDLAASWVLLPDGAPEHLYDAYRPPLDDATLRRARGWAVWRALGGILIGAAGLRGRRGGKASWGPPAQVALQRLTGTAR